MKQSNYLITIDGFVNGGNLSEGLSRCSTVCPGFNDMAGYIDKRLIARKRKDVEEHFASCRECRINLYELRILVREYKN